MDTTAAVAEYFLLHQSDQDHWTSHTNRPPSEASDFTSNFLGLNALQAYGSADQRERIAARRKQVRDWLIQTNAKDTEDRIFRLWSLRLAEAPPEDIAAAVAELLKTQRDDGGWSQRESLESDAYATGTALVALLQAGELPATTEAVHSGLKFLLSRQHADGSWQVTTRSEPFQTYYESGYPHGKDQFISITAGGWATIALLLSFPDVAPAPR